MQVFSCDCGKELKIPGKYSGRPVRCSKCGKVHQVPRIVPTSGVEEQGRSEVRESSSGVAVAEEKSRSGSRGARAVEGRRARSGGRGPGSRLGGRSQLGKTHSRFSAVLAGMIAGILVVAATGGILLLDEKASSGETARPEEDLRLSSTEVTGKLRQIDRALERFRRDKGEAPVSGGVELLRELVEEGFLEKGTLLLGQVGQGRRFTDFEATRDFLPDSGPLPDAPIFWTKSHPAIERAYVYWGTGKITRHEDEELRWVLREKRRPEPLTR